MRTGKLLVSCLALCVSLGIGGGVVRAQIHVTNARIGCLPIQKTGNLTRVVARSCNGKTQCSYKAPTPAQYRRMGVRARTRAFCTQAMEITYHCGDRRSKTVTVQGDAWKHGPAQLFCLTGAKGVRSKNPAATRILKGILTRYQRCIIEKYETRATARLPHRDRAKCATGRVCTLASRNRAWSQLQRLAAQGTAKGFENLLKSATLGDCMYIGKRRRWQTKHTHCTMECRGNHGPVKGPCFETCKAGVDINGFLQDVSKELRKHTMLFVGNFTGKGHEAVAATETYKHFGRTVATNHSLVHPKDHETCEPKKLTPTPNGYYIVPPDPNLLDWTPTEAHSWNAAITNFDPPKSPPRQQFNRPRLHNVGANEGRLRADLRAVAKKADPQNALCKSAIAFALGKNTDGNALADLSVSGRRSYARFKAHPPKAAQISRCVRADARTRRKSRAVINRSVSRALRRAYHVAQVLRAGGWPNACPQRRGLGYIAVSGEDDKPHRPTNIPSAEYAQHDLAVKVGGVTVNTRYIIAQRTGGGRSPSCAYRGLRVPAEPRPILAKDAEIILFIHGMDSRLEEAMDVIHAIQKLGQVRGKNYTVISMDLPTSGFADNIDYNLISPLTALGRAKSGPGDNFGLGFVPNKYQAPVLAFLENFVVEFTKTLDRKVPGVLKQLRVVVGGSLGGNLSMRLGRPRADAPWIRAVVPWSPAGLWGSKADNDAEHVALATPWTFAGGIPLYRAEQHWSRRSYFFGHFDWQSKALKVIAFTKPQAEEWWGDWWKCKKPLIRLARLEHYETYDANYRRWHWRLAAEQMMYSHRIRVGGIPLYARNNKRTLLMCGVQDTGGGLCENTRDVARKMTSTPGHAVFLFTTGHSIHNERPNFLARHIADFIEPDVRGISTEQDVARQGPVLRRAWTASPAACRTTCLRDGRCRGYDFRRAARPNRRGRCTLLRSSGKKSVDPDAVSGQK